MESWKVGCCWKVATKWNIRVERRRINFVFEKTEYESFIFHLLFYFLYLYSRRNSGGIAIFSVNQLDNNDISGNKEIVVYKNVNSF